MNNIYISSCGGIGNRLKNIVSGMILSSTTNKLLCVYWPINEHCECRFEDLFSEPILNFVSKDSFEQLSIPRHLDSKLIGGDINIYCKLFNMFIPTVEIQEAINNFIIKNNINDKPTIGIHYRYDNEWLDTRPDLRNQELLGIEFSQYFLDAITDRHGNNFYISAANTKCIDKFMHLKNILFLSKNTDANLSHKNKNRNKESMINAVIDMYILSLCSEIIISPRSTFSECAWYIGGCKAKLYDPIQKTYIN